MSKENVLQKKKRLLADVLDYFEKNNDFPDRKKFRLDRVDDWDLLDELERQRYFNENSNEDRDKYTLTLKGIGLLDSKASKNIIKTGNQLIPTLKKFYRQDQSENKYWNIEELANASKAPKESIKKYLFFLKGMYLYIHNRNEDKENKYFTNEISISERILKATSVEDFIKENFEENENLKPFFPKYKKNRQAVLDYGPDRIVAFLDVLGFKKISDEKTLKYFDKIANILKQLKLIEGNSDIEYVLISDSVVLSFPFTKGKGLKKLNEFLIALGRIQADLCLDDIWLRGAVTIGKIRMRKDEYGNQIVYGPALIAAHELESKYAKFPRIILDPQTFNKIKIGRKELSDELNKLNQKNRFFKNVIFDPASAGHFLLPEVKSPGISVPNDAIWINYVEYLHLDLSRFNKFSDNLKKNLYSEQQYFDKYKWVQSYTILYCKPKNGFDPYSGELGECFRKLEAL